MFMWYSRCWIDYFYLLLVFSFLSLSCRVGGRECLFIPESSSVSVSMSNASDLKFGSRLKKGVSHD
jgi:hypothetical protein